jgi:hypothetical protein
MNETVKNIMLQDYDVGTSIDVVRRDMRVLKTEYTTLLAAYSGSMRNAERLENSLKERVTKHAKVEQKLREEIADLEKRLKKKLTLWERICGRIKF